MKIIQYIEYTLELDNAVIVNDISDIKRGDRLFYELTAVIQGSLLFIDQKTGLTTYTPDIRKFTNKYKEVYNVDEFIKNDYFKNDLKTGNQKFVIIKA